jgi:hypothetical protein
VERPSFDEAYYSPESAYAQYDYPSPPSSDYRRYQYPPPPPDARHQYITPTASRDMEQAEEVYHTSPYTYVQQPRLKEETILRKKFSWKHYPEVRQRLLQVAVVSNHLFELTFNFVSCTCFESWNSF